MAAESPGLAARVLGRASEMRPSAGEAYSDRIASGPTGCEWGERQGGHRACRSWERRHELSSCPDDVSGGEARIHAPVRSPDRDGASKATTWLIRR